LIELVDFLHNVNGLAHLDIKPDNIIVNDDFSLSFIDFGHTNYVNADLDFRVGTDSYMSPEVRQVKMSPGKSSFNA
jgi:serine/threonine protein kinase